MLSYVAFSHHDYAVRSRMKRPLVDLRAEPEPVLPRVVA
jgi:hypothetical protein